MILKTYIRVYVASIQDALPFYESLTATSADLRFTFGDVELAAVGDFLLIGGDDVALAPLRGAIGPVVVDDLNAHIDRSRAAGAQLAQAPARSATGVYAYLVHPDGTRTEYVQWDPEIADRILR